MNEPILCATCPSFEKGVQVSNVTGLVKYAGGYCRHRNITDLTGREAACLDHPEYTDPDQIIAQAYNNLYIESIGQIIQRAFSQNYSLMNQSASDIIETIVAEWRQSNEHKLREALSEVVRRIQEQAVKNAESQVASLREEVEELKAELREQMRLPAVNE